MNTNSIRLLRSEHAIGIDIGGTNIAAALVSSQGKITHYRSVPTKAFQGGPAVLKRTQQLIKQIITATNAKRKTILGIGVNCPGAIDPTKGIPLAPTPHIPNWQGLPIKKQLAKIFQLPVRVENDVNALALAEKTWGSGRNVSNLFCLTIGTGIGGGIIINNQLHRGHHFYAGEIGHLMVKSNGPKCNCGRQGCLEALAGGPAIVRQTITLIRKSSIPSRLRTIIKNDSRRLNPQIIFDAAKKGDRLAQKIVQETAGYIGIALSYVVNLLDPEIIVVGGGIARSGKILFNPIRNTVAKHIIPSPIRRIKIIPAHLNEKTGVLGSAALVFESASIPSMQIRLNNITYPIT